jgi:hypothetical protein
VESMGGKSSLGLLEFMVGKGSLVMSLLCRRRMGGSSIDDLMALVCASVSDAQS